MKRLRFQPNVAAEVRAIDKSSAIQILRAIHQYQTTGEGKVKALSGDLQGLLRLRVGKYRVLFGETESTITIHRVRHRSEAYR